MPWQSITAARSKSSSRSSACPLSANTTRAAFGSSRARRAPCCSDGSTRSRAATTMRVRCATPCRYRSGRRAARHRLRRQAAAAGGSPSPGMTIPEACTPLAPAPPPTRVVSTANAAATCSAASYTAPGASSRSPSPATASAAEASVAKGTSGIAALCDDEALLVSVSAASELPELTAGFMSTSLDTSSGASAASISARGAKKLSATTVAPPAAATLGRLARRSTAAARVSPGHPSRLPTGTLRQRTSYPAAMSAGTCSRTPSPEPSSPGMYTRGAPPPPGEWAVARPAGARSRRASGEAPGGSGEAMVKSSAGPAYAGGLEGEAPSVPASGTVAAVAPSVAPARAPNLARTPEVGDGSASAATSATVDRVNVPAALAAPRAARTVPVDSPEAARLIASCA
mmetsp:Transcript_31275/g.78335  ORF Transcript_31275/g.78335 Transcript_31275/m.78335 type:complete len:401 (-) Transcript_31275:671-1873(-)